MYIKKKKKIFEQLLVKRRFVIVIPFAVSEQNMGRLKTSLKKGEPRRSLEVQNDVKYTKALGRVKKLKDDRLSSGDRHR